MIVALPKWSQDAYEILGDLPFVLACDVLEVADNRIAGLSAKYEVSFVAVVAVELGQEQFELAILVPTDFPLVLPKTYLLNGADYRGRAHVEHEGQLSWLCYIEATGHVTDIRDENRVFREVVDKIIEALRAGQPANRRREFGDELDIYWSKQPSCYAVAADIGNLEQPGSLEYWLNKNGKVAFIGDKEGAKRRADRLRMDISGSPAVYIPLKKIDLTGFSHSQLLYPGSFQRIIGMPRQWSHEVVALLQKPSVKRHVFVFGWERASGQRILFGSDIRTNGHQNPLFEKHVWRSVTPLLMVSANPEVLLRRGGGNANLGSKHVMIVGCGSLGGATATLLAKSGVGQLTLVDNDTFDSANIQRHVLGRKAVSKAKVDALAEALVDGSHSLKINKKNVALAEFIHDPAVDWSSFDAIISATGDHDTDRLLNKHLWHSKVSTPLIVQWVEAYGVGAHVVGTKPGAHSKGCLECLFSRHDDHGSFTGCAAAFTAPDQRASQVLVGCAGSYTPFGFLDSMRCSERAARAFLEIMADGWEGFFVDSLKGQSADAESNGLRACY